MANPIQYSQKIPVPVGRDAKEFTEAVIAGEAALTGAKPRRGDAVRTVGLRHGSHHNQIVVIRDDRPPLKKRPLPEKAWQLLLKYHRMVSIYESILQELPAVEAGSAILGLGKRATYDLINQYKPYGDPDDWFEAEARSLHARGQFVGGRGTELSQRSRAFFHVLGGGATGISYWRDQFAGLVRVYYPHDLKAAMAEVRWGWIEACDFWVHNGRFC